MLFGCFPEGVETVTALGVLDGEVLDVLSTEAEVNLSLLS